MLACPRPSAVAANEFPRRARLLKPGEYQRVFEKPVVSSDQFFRVLARAGEGEESRLGLAVSRKVDLRATARNRIKRVIRESFRLIQPDASGCQAQGGQSCDYVVLALSPASGAANAQLSDSLAGHWIAIAHKMDRATGKTQ